MKYRVNKSQTSGRRRNLSCEISVRRYECIRRYLQEGVIVLSLS